MKSPERVELCVGGVVFRDDALLMVRRATNPGQGQWSLPGGRVEPGETMHQAVVRELAEETGVTVICDEPIGWVEQIADGYHFVIVNFAATAVSGETPLGASDAAEAAFVPRWTVSELDLVEDLFGFLADHGIVETLA